VKGGIIYGSEKEKEKNRKKKETLDDSI